MARKKKNSEEPNVPANPDADETPDHMTEPVSAAQEASVPDQDEAVAADAPVKVSESEESPSPDDLLDDVRRALIEDDVQDSQKQSKWWQRIGMGGGKQDAQAEQPKVIQEIDLPRAQEISDAIDTEDLKSDEYTDQIDDLIDLLDEETETAPSKPADVEAPPAEPAKPVDLEQLKKQAFQARTEAAGVETVSEVRSIALEGDEEVFVEVESKPADPLNERVKAVENALKPYRRYVFFAIAFLGVVIAGIALAITLSAVQRLRPAPTPIPAADLPYPTAVSLPGGWTFNLGRGRLTEGNWQPAGAEWLEGTEVCRWVSLPWSRQLEAVVRTLNQDDEINLAMSNNDQLVYKVFSISEMSPDQLQTLDTNTPCLLIMLTGDDADTRWVLTAKP